jgi:DNA-binding transcriptional regulator LsrR (DeoR family)
LKKLHSISATAPTLVGCFITEVEARELLKQGAVAEILCNFFNVEGELIDHELNDRNTSVKLKNQTNFHTISILGASTKHQSLSASLHGG